MAYAIEYLSSAVRALKKLPPSVNAGIIAKIESLSANPRGPGTIKIQGAETYRV